MIERIFRRIWYDGGTGPVLTILRLLLAPLSVLYGLFISARNRRFDLGEIKPHRLPCRVVSVGNLSVGGTGKTPLVIEVARMLQARGYRVVVLSRGYGGTSQEPVNLVSNGTKLFMNQQEAGDEPILIAKAAPGVPVLTGSRRVDTGNWAVKNLDADVLILDDGFQHRQLARDIDIVLLNAVSPFGNGRLLPAGPLREPPAALKRADILVLTGAREDFAVFRLPAVSDEIQTPIFGCCYRPRNLLQGIQETVFPLALVNGKKVCAFAGIGNPAAFEKTLRSLGADVAAFIPFPDHHRYGEQDIALIEKKARRCGAQMIVTTEKDKIKLERFEAYFNNVYILRIELDFASGREAFERVLLEKLHENFKC